MTTAPDDDDNHVFLRGRLADEPTTKELPSGDELTVFRLTVSRPPGDRVRVDSIECATTRARPRRALERAAVGAVVEVSGSLRRRFWRGPAGPASRYTVDVATARVIRSDRAGGASRARTPASA
ncbi:single-stranded DNA-binding protein [Jatrophihabitans endophyticus]|uniref:single-stranded DNA-binding protein n=1 Tax=Jatrophihabitans endophyticus TaxID=1206085 RepID=UPI00093426BF|nr:single-stranded DNA-binding protein [Jatrophihabitans endophyticus]